MSRLAWIGLGCGLAAGLLSPLPASARAVANPYWHAMRVEAQREAFWRGHRHGRSATDRVEWRQQTDARQAAEWQSQARGRALCQAYGGCL